VTHNLKMIHTQCKRLVLLL